MANRTFDAAQFYADYGARHPEDRSRLFEAVSQAVDADRVLYPGCYIDIAPSIHFDDVTYIDTDRRAARFFAQQDAVHHIVSQHRSTTRTSRPFHVEFHHQDYTTNLPIADESIDLLISLYAGFISEHCTRYVGIGGHLLVNSSHGDAAMASLDPRWRLAAVVNPRGDRYHVRTERLDDYLIPKRGTPPTHAELHQLGRGIAYTRTAAAYLFAKVAR
ncbi:MAG: hypothetical protein ACE37B_07910 [Ilumatobacter sp.]|jgi:hypothetical protein|uniref:hypothetical protein n=1 Tax=Ilumatobacter sp. TaxID=1967498 RepID=UPI00391C7EAB